MKSTCAATCHLLDDEQRHEYSAGLFGNQFPLRLEPVIYQFASSLSHEYQGGYWKFYAICNGGFFMAPAWPEQFNVMSENGFQGSMSSEAFGITVCLYAFGHLSFQGYTPFTAACADQYHLLRELALSHREARVILAAID